MLLGFTRARVLHFRTDPVTARNASGLKLTMAHFGRALIVLLILAAVIYAAGMVHTARTASPNLVRHKTNEYAYGHYSAITHATKLWHPLYWLTTSQWVTLEAGDSLWIPQYWWHWVESEPATVAINTWTGRVRGNMPSMIARPQTLRQTNFYPGVLPRVRSYTGDVTVWDSARDVFLPGMPFAHFLRSREDGKYIITLDAHSSAPGSKKFNDQLYAHVAPAIQPPAFWTTLSADSSVEANLWISSGAHDTGLHYDTSYGLLTVLQGRKRVQLFAPDQAKFLRPLSVIPRWAALTTPIRMEYNIFRASKVSCTSGTLPSARLLYESLHVGGSESFMKLVGLLQSHVGENNIVYGVKQVCGSGSMRWELYSYHYNKFSRHQPAAAGMDTMLLPAPLAGDVVVHSKDFVLNGEGSIVLGTDTHTYRGLTQLNYPHMGCGHTLPQGSEESRLESLYIISGYQDVRTNLAAYLDYLQYAPSLAPAVLTLLQKYKCTDVALFQKFDGNVFIIYMGLPVHDYADFLETFRYPAQLAQHVRVHVQQYRDVVHEVAVVYALDTLAPVRSAFYGVL